MIACTAIAVMVLGACTSTGALLKGVPGRDRPARIVLYGDSLAEQAASFFVKALTPPGRASIAVRTAPGSAPCDWLSDMPKTVAGFRPDAAVVEFSGNNLTPCMRDPRTGAPLAGDDLVARYRLDAEKAIRILSRHGATVYWIGAPPDRLPQLSLMAAKIKEMDATLPATFDNVRYVDAGQAVTLNGAYADYLPCLPNEPCTGPYGTNRVRAPDGVHFCPVLVTGRAACPVWSSGAFRFGRAMAQPLIDAYGL